MKEKKEEVKARDEGYDLSHYVLKVVDLLEENNQFSAAHTCSSALTSITGFLGSESVPIHEAYTAEILKAYQSWLMERESAPNTISTYMRSLKAVYNRWTPPGTVDHNPTLFKDVNTRVESPTKRALTPKQMNELESTDFNRLTEEQQHTLAYFLLMFMLRGMPFIDLAHLRKTDMQGRTIVYTRHKTDRPIIVDVPTEAMRLIRKFKDRTDSVYLFPILEDKRNADKETDSTKPNDNGKGDNIKSGNGKDSNRKQKESRKQYDHYQAALRKFNRSLGALMKELLPGVKVSSYTARHTWATLAYHIGVPVEKISQSMGHSSILVTMAYLKPFDHEMIDKINRQVLSFVKQCKWKNKGHATHYRARN